MKRELWIRAEGTGSSGNDRGKRRVQRTTRRAACRTRAGQRQVVAHGFNRHAKALVKIRHFSLYPGQRVSRDRELKQNADHHKANRGGDQELDQPKSPSIHRAATQTTRSHFRASMLTRWMESPDSDGLPPRVPTTTSNTRRLSGSPAPGCTAQRRM